MADLKHYCQEIETVIQSLDTGRDEVAICHLQDALDALHATMDDEPTRYARSDTIVHGIVWGQARSAK